ncbi:MAG TPA: methyltransferase [Mycobacteriales bacterium]|nr:methyltransferase [Mycobacteriales bacterium]
MTAETMSVPPPAAAAAVSPEPILRLASGFMAAKHLFAADELGLFEALGEGPATLDAVAARTGLTRRAARISADAMVALGLVERDGDTYRNGEVAAQYLSGVSPADLRPLLRFWDRISYPAWQGLAQALATGPGREVFDLDDELQELVSKGIEAVLAGPTAALPQNVDLAGRRLLDVGGGTGSWSIALARRFPDLRATVLELPVVAEVARQRVADADLGSRIDVLTGDAMTGDLPASYDAFLVANLVHYWSPEQNVDLLRRIRAAAAPASVLLLVDFWTDPTHTQPMQAALMAGEFAVHLRNGDVYSVEEARGWLGAAGWRFVEHRPLAGPVSLVVAEPA